MKKKVLSAMLVAAMTATMFAGCGSDKGTTDGTQGAASPKADTQVERPVLDIYRKVREDGYMEIDICFPMK